MKFLRTKKSIFLIVLLFFFSLAHELKSSCSVPFGTLIGESHATKAYNNCGSEYLEDEFNYIYVSGIEDPVFTGLKWQCVEYARRFLIENKGITFESIDYAFQIWDLKTFEDIYTNKRLPVTHCENTSTPIYPCPGDLLIYNNELVYTGHVAVILEVSQEFVAIGEQNFDDGYWKKTDYARRLPLLQDENGNYSIIDDAIIGWIRAK